MIKSYIDLALKILPALAILAVGGYVWYLSSQLDSAVKTVSDLRTQLANVEETVNNVRTRLNIEDTVRQLPDPAGVLRDRFSRPQE